MNGETHCNNNLELMNKSKERALVSLDGGVFVVCRPVTASEVSGPVLKSWKFCTYL